VPVELKKGFPGRSSVEEVSPDARGCIHIRCKELERIELRVSPAGNKVEGYLVAGQRLRRLPIGSVLDSKTGTFSWIPGPGYRNLPVGFCRDCCNGEQCRIEIMVTIVPKFSIE